MDGDQACPPGTESGQDRLAERMAEFEADLSGMRTWASNVQGQLKSLHEHTGLLAEQLSSSADIHPLVGYKPTSEQQIKLFAALAKWQNEAPVLEKKHTASFDTTTGGRVKYDYASPGDVSALARTAGAHGLSHFHQMQQTAVRTYLFHAEGGFLYTDVPLLTSENKALSPIQIWSRACTSAKRLGILAVLGILPDDTDDAGNPREDQATNMDRRRAPLPVKPAPLPAENIRRVGAQPSQPVADGGHG